MAEWDRRVTVTWIMPGTEINSNNNGKVQRSLQGHGLRPSKCMTLFCFVMMSRRRCLQVRRPDKGGSTVLKGSSSDCVCRLKAKRRLAWWNIDALLSDCKPIQVIQC